MKLTPSKLLRNLLRWDTNKMTLPIKPVSMPSILDGCENGKIPVGKLRTIKTIPTAYMCLPAADAFDALFDAYPGQTERQVGHYRSFDQQLTLFISRYNPVNQTTYNNTPSAHRKIWHTAKDYGYSSIYWVKKNNNLATAAVPGTSNHGWGLALDIAEEYDQDTSPDGIRTAFVNWLINNADRFGICAELQSEVWHWRYYAGDNVPQAVLEYLGEDQPTPPEEDEMDVINPPRRVLDTRIEYGGSGPLNAGIHEVDLKVVNWGAKACEITVTAIPRSPVGFVGVGSNKDSFLNWSEYQQNQAIPTTVTVPVVAGKVNLYVHNTTDLIVSVRTEA